MVDLASPSIRDWDFPRSVSSVSLLATFAEECGVSRAAILRDTGLAPAALEAPDAQVEGHQELAVVRNLVRGLPERPWLGLEVGNRYRPTTFGIFGFACVSSPTLRDAMKFALRYLELSFIFCIPIVTVEHTRIQIELSAQQVPEDVRRFLLERDLAAIYTVITDILSNGVPLQGLDLQFDEPSYADRYERFFGIRPNFAQPRNVVTLDAAYLDRLLPQANEHTVALCVAQCQELVARRHRHTGVTREVRDQLLRVGGVAESMEEVAGQLGMSPRTLRRRLTEAGTSYRGLVDEVREVLAEEMLTTGVLSVDDVAVRLGYGEASSFIHAFKRWKGVTPAAYMRHRRVGTRR